LIAVEMILIALLAGAPAPPKPECEPVLVEKIAPGRWATVRVKVNNSSGDTGKVYLRQTVGGRDQQTAAGELGAGQQGEYLLPFRPLSPNAQLRVVVVRQKKDGSKAEDRTGFGRTSRFAGGAVVVVAPPGGPTLPLPAAGARTVPARSLPDYPAGYDGVGLLVLGRFPRGAAGGFKLGQEQQKALATWFRAGGKMVVESGPMLLAASKLLRSKPILAGEIAGRDDWLRLLGAEERDVLLWEGDRPLVARFGMGFGRGLYVDRPAGEWSARWVEAAKSAYAELVAEPSYPCVPLTARRLYNQPGSSGDFPTLEKSLVGAGAALRWAVGGLLAVGAAAVLFWRRKGRGRLAAAASLAAAAFAVVVVLAARPPDLLVLSFRVDEFSADGLGVRAREFLYVERTGGGAVFDVTAPARVLPGPVLFEEAEAGRVSFTLRGDGEGWRLAKFSSTERSVFMGAGPLYGAAEPDRSGASVDGPGAAAEAAVAGCLAGEGHRLRPQAEFLAAALLGEGRLGRALASSRAGDGSGVKVRRLPDADPGPALAVEGVPHRTVRLGRLGIFYGEGK
jgi:hypothetical protein